MKIKKDFMLRSVAGQNIVVPTGDAQVNFNGMISLNESGAFLWSKMSSDVTEKELVDAILAEYDVSEMIAKIDVEIFVKKMRKACLLDE